ncbi:hypothetical protein D3OALGB2SA_2502 [Olavius algarvensis associated proteobacterium Delta 3]|nr:hypothetical protein D3OALGB2SA_2502 [Olavius algarvensis associated proteobacterium Delta 3]
MSKKNAVAFLNRLAEDKALAHQVKNAGKGHIAEIAGEVGYSFTLGELESIAGEIKGDTDELSDDLLEMVVGGLDTHFAGNPFLCLGEAYDHLIRKE